MQAASSQSISPSPEFHYPGYVWIIPGWYKDNWWREEVARDLEISCSDQDLEQFILNTLSIQISNNTIDSISPTDVNLVRHKLIVIAIGFDYLFSKRPSLNLKMNISRKLICLDTI